LVLAALGLTLGAIACDTQEPGASASAADFDGDEKAGAVEGDPADGHAADEVEHPTIGGEEPGGEEPEAGEPAADPSGRVPMGGVREGDVVSCTTAADCESGICEGLGCGPGMGRCVAKERTCTADLVAYCGCDGQTFRSSGTCAKQRYAHKGECKDPLPAGSPCTTGGQCESGSCVGDGLEGCGADDHGTCADKPPMCTRDLRAYCGCDGHTFRSSGSCPGRSFRHRGACKP
jgi:hypothetical protein